MLSLKRSVHLSTIRLISYGGGGGDSWKTSGKQGKFYPELPEGFKPTHIIVGAGSAGCVLVCFQCGSSYRNAFLGKSTLRKSG